jgi:hypothetical protein
MLNYYQIDDVLARRLNNAIFMLQNKTYISEPAAASLPHPRVEPSRDQDTLLNTQKESSIIDQIDNNHSLEDTDHLKETTEHLSASEYIR